ncbi:MAG: hypothetical protein WAW10_01040 [Gallionella sp.]
MGAATPSTTESPHVKPEYASKNRMPILENNNELFDIFFSRTNRSSISCKARFAENHRQPGSCQSDLPASCEFLKEADKVKRKQRLFLRNQVSINLCLSIIFGAQLGEAEKSAQVRDGKRQESIIKPIQANTEGRILLGMTKNSKRPRGFPLGRFC